MNPDVADRHQLAPSGQPRCSGDRGDMVQVLSWGAVSVVAIIAIGAAMETFGVNVVSWAARQLGIG